MEQNCLNDSGDSKRGKRNTRSQSKKNASNKSSQNQSQEASSSFEVVHFMPNDIIPTILECKENEGSKVVRYPITTIGKIFDLSS